MMKDFSPLVYSIPVHQEPTLYFGEFSAIYKGFRYKKEPAHNLFYIVCPEGRVLPYDLSGRFSKTRFLEEAITKWLEVNTFEDLPLEPKPPRSHHKPISEGGVG
jgi:hypothetical protein